MIAQVLQSFAVIVKRGWLEGPPNLFPDLLNYIEVSRAASALPAPPPPPPPPPPPRNLPHRRYRPRSPPPPLERRADG